MKSAALSAFACALCIILAACASDPAALSVQDTVLLNAIRNRAPSALDKALSDGANANAVDRKRTPFIILAAASGNEYAVKRLIACGANVNAADPDGNTALHSAAAGADSEIVETLIISGATADARGVFGKTPLMEAARMGRVENMRLLLKHGAGVNARDWRGAGVPAFAAVAQKNAIEALELCRENGLGHISPDTEIALSPLLNALRYGKRETAWYLLENMPDFDTTGLQPAGQIAMRFAIYHDDLKMVKKLFEKKVRLNHNLPLAFQAARIANVDGVYKLMARAGAIDKGYSPLHWAAIYGRYDIAKYLLEQGADPNLKSNEGKTPSHYANDQPTCKLIDKAADAALEQALENEKASPVQKQITEKQ